MADIFDTVAEEPAKDIFDEVSEPSDFQLGHGVPLPSERQDFTPQEQSKIEDLSKLAASKPTPVQDFTRGVIDKFKNPVSSIVNFPNYVSGAITGKPVDPSTLPLPPGYNPLRIEVPPDANIRPEIRPYAEAVADTASSLTDPNVLATLPFVEAKVAGVPSALGKLYVAQMAYQLPGGAAELKRILEDPNTDSDTKKKAATQYALLFAGTALGAKGSTIERGAPKFSIPKEVKESATVLPKAAEEIAKVEPSPTEAPAASGEAKVAEVNPTTETPKPGAELKPALKVGDNIYPAEGKESSHVEIIQRVKSGPQPDLTGLEEGFVDPKGEFIDRKTAAKETGLPTDTESGKLHSSDLVPEPLPGQMPVEIKGADGKVYKAAVNGFYDMTTLGKGIIPSVGRWDEKGWSHGMLKPGEEIVTPGVTPESFAKFKEGASNPAAPTTPDIKGMGGAVPSEFEASPQTPTGIKNATVDKERAARGLPPAVEPARKSFGEVWDRAMAERDQNPVAQDELIKELRDKPRALTDQEDALLLHRQIDLQNEYGKATRDLNQAFDDGRTDDIESARYRVAAFSDQLLDLYNITKESGTETGRGLNARKMMANEDFTLASMEVQKRAAKGGARLTEKEAADLKDLQQRIERTQKAYDDYVSSAEQRLSEANAQKAVAEAKAEAAQKGVPAHIRVLADKILSVIDTQADAARARIKARGGSLFAGVDPTVLYDVSVIGASHILHGADTFAAWSAKMVGDFSERIKPHLDEIWKASNKQVDSQAEQVAGKKNASPAAKAARSTNPQDRIDAAERTIGARIAAGKRNEISPQVQRLARMLVQRGVTDMHQLIDTVHSMLQKADPTFTRREAMDAISGYGQFTALSKDQISVQLRDLKGQMQQTAKLLDMFEGEAPAKTGFERRTPSDAERRQIQQVEEAKKRFGIQATDPATQLKTSLASLKTRLKNQISDLEEQLATKTKFVKERAPVPEDAETTTLRSKRDALKSDFDQMFGKPEMSDEQRVKLALNSLERQAAEVERQLKEGDIFSVAKESKTLNTPEIEAARAKLDALKTERDYLRESIQPKQRMSPDEMALKSLKTRLKNRTAELLEKIAKGDFSTKVKKVATLDAEATRLKVLNEKAKRQFQEGLLRDRMEKRSKAEKARDTVLNWSRGFLLSAPTVLAKLTAAAAIRIVTTPLEEAVGAGFSKAFPRVAEKAPRQGDMNVKAEAKALTEAITTGMKDAWQTLRTGESDLDILYGKIRAKDPSIINFFGHVHGALKAPVKRAEFARSLEKRMAHSMENGVDVADPAVQVRLATEAYKDANRAIFMQDNRVVKAYRAAMATLKAVDKSTGKPSLGTSAIATVTEGALPIVKVPSNIVGEIMETAVGSVTGSVRLANAYRKGVENLKPEEADIILRQLKKGSLGAAVLALGFFNADSVGGFYQRNQKRPEDEVQPKEVKIGDATIPALYLHAPLPEALQIGATIRRVADSKLRKKDTDTQGIPAGIMAGALGVVEEVPFVKEMTELDRFFSDTQRSQYLNELGRARLVPQILQQIARATDKNEYGEKVKRKPGTFLEGIESGIPGLRQNVPEDPRP